MLESESCKSSINGEGEGEFRKELLFHSSEAAPSLAILLGTCKGCLSEIDKFCFYALPKRARETFYWLPQGSSIAFCFFYALTIVQHLRHTDVKLGLTEGSGLFFPPTFLFSVRPSS